MTLICSRWLKTMSNIPQMTGFDGDSPWSESNKIILNKHSNLTIISHQIGLGKVSKSVFGTEAQWVTSRVSPNDPGSLR